MYARVNRYAMPWTEATLKLLEKEHSLSTPTSEDRIREVRRDLKNTRIALKGLAIAVQEIESTATPENVSLTSHVSIGTEESIVLTELILYGVWNAQAGLREAPITVRLMEEDIQTAKQRQQRERIKALLAEWDTNPDDTPEEWWDDFNTFLREHRLNLR